MDSEGNDGGLGGRMGIMVDWEGEGDNDGLGRR